MKSDVIVYAIVGPGADAPYIGITTHSLEERFAEHVKKDPLSECSKLGVAIRKHGADKFRIKEIYHAKSWDEACAKEREYIEYSKKNGKPRAKLHRDTKGNYKLNGESIVVPEEYRDDFEKAIDDFH